MTKPANPKNSESPKTAFSVAASPFNPVKLELVIILIVGFVFWLVLNSITDDDLTHFAILFLYSISGAAWLIWRISKLSRETNSN